MNSVLVTGGAGFIGSNFVRALGVQFPESHVVVVDDFRSGDFRNLQGFKGDIVAVDASRLDFNRQFDGVSFDAIFHFASITDTTVHDQRLQVHDNVEGFRRLLDFAVPSQTPVFYASSAATYGTGRTVMSEGMEPAPANVYAFTKVQLDNLARETARKHLAWRVVGLRYFNVYGMNEGHKGAAASMIYQLYKKMKAGERPRVFVAGEQKRDFVYVEDVVAMTLKCLEAPQSGIYNCGSGRATSFNEVIAILNDSLGTNLETEYFENPYDFYQPHTEADMSLAKAELGFEPRYQPQEGIRDYVKRLEGAYSVG